MEIPFANLSIHYLNQLSETLAFLHSMGFMFIIFNWFEKKMKGFPLPINNNLNCTESSESGHHLHALG